MAVKMHMLAKWICMKKAIALFQPLILLDIRPKTVVRHDDRGSSIGFSQNYVIGSGSTGHFDEETVEIIKQIYVRIGIVKSPGSCQLMTRIGVKNATEVTGVLGDMQHDGEEIR